jgi:hypothetical protein
MILAATLFGLALAGFVFAVITPAQAGGRTGLIFFGIVCLAVAGRIIARKNR